MPPRPSRYRAYWAGPALLLISTLVSLLTIELVLRLIAGHSILTAELGAFEVSVQDSERDLTEFASSVSIADGFDPAWINIDPPSLPGREQVDPELLAWRDKAHEIGWESFDTNLYRQWNAAYLGAVDCQADLPIVSTPAPLYEFDAPYGSILPLFRYLPQRTDPLGMRTNQFAWRGPEIPLDKPPGTVRLAFVGASTTVGSKHCRASYPEYVVHWLNLWAQTAYPELHFDVINAGREGLTSSHIMAVVRAEVLPMEPDLILYYEGVNQLSRWIATDDGLTDVQAPYDVGKMPAGAMLTGASRYSVLAARLTQLLVGLQLSGDEPSKPAHTMTWPRGVSRTEPDPFDENLPFYLPLIIRDLDKMKRMATQSGSELAMASFVFLAEDGMTLDPWRDGLIESFYTNQLWPLSYAEIREFADFQNRVFKAYARARLVPFVDLADAYPQDPSFFLDGVHFNCDGIRLQAWVVMQKMVRLIKTRIAAGDWPQPDRQPLESHPGIETPRLAENFCSEPSATP